ncbi:MAG: phenazine biosynthesis protein PhzF [Maricaulis sp.]|jgi:PhzF family phenazine biosynthesis protein|nr:phenazine biosynthesis protein PhzF [Maricaulis sp.]HAQ36661.1 PhzF family phenazine biosynthesis protein [Alphaproteobacteria bacterium]
MVTLPYAELHAFADGDLPFTGNPAGVCLLETWPDNRTLLGIALSNNLSETAFLVPKTDEADAWELRWFTPTVEVDLCGHATFASGAWLHARGAVNGDEARFDTRSGRLTVRRDGDLFAMDLPKVSFETGQSNPLIEEALGGGKPDAIFDVKRIHGADYKLVIYPDEGIVARLRPDHATLAVANTNTIVTAPGDRTDFVSRFFAPASGVTEDPVTGSAHCTLAPYWGERLGKSRMTARQIGPRSGALEVEPKGERVTLIGRATPYLDGQLTL